MALTLNIIIVQAKSNNKYEEWLVKHKFKVHYVAHYSYDASNYDNERLASAHYSYPLTDERRTGRDEWDRMHIRLWFIFSPAHGYVVVGNVHLENAAFPEHEIIHIGNDYSYGYEYAEDIFAREFSSTISQVP
ncbi:MAG: hypothetical protein J7J99_07335 [Thermoprotei archaeon]|nr:hypothetical protein [Thermoprotei archaeon]